MTILDDIAEYKRREVAAAKQVLSQDALEAEVKIAPPVRGFRAALAAAKASRRVGLIAEIKKASPSKGLIRADFNPPELARAYEDGGACCLSVLTDTPSFQGAPGFLTAARSACALPALRKDFLVDPYQVAEARAWGGDAILVILAMVDDTLAAELMAEAQRFGLDILVETHNKNEVERALALGADLVGINNRNLHTFETTLETTLTLAPMIPPEVLIVAESGFSHPNDLERIGRAGVNCFLIGEGLMRQTDVTAATRELTQIEL